VKDGGVELDDEEEEGTGGGGSEAAPETEAVDVCAVVVGCPCDSAAEATDALRVEDG
jgi:hypothetical protein